MGAIGDECNDLRVAGDGVEPFPMGNRDAGAERNEGDAEGLAVGESL